MARETLQQAGVPEGFAPRPEQQEAAFDFVGVRMLFKLSPVWHLSIVHFGNDYSAYGSFDQFLQDDLLILSGVCMQDHISTLKK